MSTEYRIVRRSNSQYHEIGMTCDSYAIALEIADCLERGMNDGEYLVRREDEPNWTPPTYLNQGVSD